MTLNFLKKKIDLKLFLFFWSADFKIVNVIPLHKISTMLNFIRILPSFHSIIINYYSSKIPLIPSLYINLNLRKKNEKEFHGKNLTAVGFPIQPPF